MGVDYNAHVCHGWKLDRNKAMEAIGRLEPEALAEDDMDYALGTVLRKLGIDRQSGGISYLDTDRDPGVVFVGVCTAELWIRRKSSTLVTAPTEQDVADLAVLQKALDLPPSQVLLVGVVW